jgi:capsular polysaccharide biosynthesis protein
VAVRQRRSRPGGDTPGRSRPAAWPLAVSVLGGWLRRQSRRPGPIGDAASVAVVVVNRSASLLREVGDELARATSSEEQAAPKPVPGKRRSGGAKEAHSKSRAPGRSKAGS